MSARSAHVVTAAATCLACAAAVAKVGTIRHDVDDAVYVNLGATFANVGQVAFSDAEGDWLGSGTLIAPQWVLTAGHVVERATAWNFTIGGNTYTAAPDSLVPHPQWDGDLFGGYDIGLARLDAPVTGVIPAVRYTGSAELGQVGTAAGFGKTGTGQTGATTYDGIKRAGQNVIDDFHEPGQRILLSDFDSGEWLDNTLWSGSAVPRDLEYLIAPGDSGGGLFVPDPGGAGWLLAGVHSFVMAGDLTPDSDYGDISGHTRVSVFNDWIDAVTEATIPEPFSASMVLMAVCGLRVYHRRRRKMG